MKKWLFTILLGSAVVLGACGGGSSTKDGDTTETAAGEAVYKSNCSACHGADLSGGAGPALSTIGDKYSADEIADIIENGIGNMGPQKQVNADDRAAVAEWLAAKK